jgi:hypothetical protein
MAKLPSPILKYRQLMKRQRQIEKDISRLMSEKESNGFKILKLVLDHQEVQKIHQSK